jgi:hypothetical protein
MIKRNLIRYLAFHIGGDTTRLIELSSADSTDFEISSDSDAGKFKIREERNGSAAAVVEFA